MQPALDGMGPPMLQHVRTLGFTSMQWKAIKKIQIEHGMILFTFLNDYSNLTVKGRQERHPLT